MEKDVGFIEELHNIAGEQIRSKSVDDYLDEYYKLLFDVIKDTIRESAQAGNYCVVGNKKIIRGGIGFYSVMDKNDVCVYITDEDGNSFSIHNLDTNRIFYALRHNDRSNRAYEKIDMLIYFTNKSLLGRTKEDKDRTTKFFDYVYKNSNGVIKLKRRIMHYDFTNDFHFKKRFWKTFEFEIEF